MLTATGLVIVSRAFGWTEMGWSYIKYPTHPGVNISKSNSGLQGFVLFCFSLILFSMTSVSRFLHAEDPEIMDTGYDRFRISHL